MATNLVDKKLVLDYYELTSETLRFMYSNNYIPQNFTVGSTVWLDGIECVVIAKDLTGHGASSQHIAIDKYYDLSDYCRYIGDTWGTKKVDNLQYFVSGGYGRTIDYTNTDPDAIGSGEYYTEVYLGNKDNGTNGTATINDNTNYPSLWRAVSDFRNAHGNKWFLPSSGELRLLHTHNLFGTVRFNNGINEDNPYYWTSSPIMDNSYDKNCVCMLSNPPSGTDLVTTYPKYFPLGARMCRAF